MNRRIRGNGLLLNITALIIVALFLFPLYWIVVNSFKNPTEIFRNPPTLFPQEPTLQTYVVQFHNTTFLQSFANSVLISAGSLVLCLVLSVPCSYGLAIFQFPGKKSALFSFLITQMMPATLVLTPLYLMFSKAGLLNTHIAPVLGCITVSIPYVVVMLRPFFLSLPKSISEAALMDGCTRFSAFARVMVPIAKPGIITSGAFAFIFAWSDLIFSMTFNSQDRFRPMTANIFFFMTKYGLEWNKIMAYGMLLVMPVLLVFLLLQRHIVSGILAGSIKE